LADPTGKTDSTLALQSAIDYSRRNSLTLWLPSGEYRISKTLVAKQTIRLDAVDGANHYWQQARYVPNRIVGSTKGPKPTIVLAPRTFTDAAKPQPVVWLWMQNGSPGPFRAPYDGQPQPNANCNQIFQGIDIQISPGNPGAIGVRARGAQMMVVQDVTIFAGEGLVGLSGGSGSGGSHYGVTVIGGKFGVDFTTTQPGPVISGFTLENQTCSALVYAGLQTLTVVGLRVKASVPMAMPPIVTGCDPTTKMVPTWQGELFGEGCQLPQFVHPWIVQPCRPGDSGALSIVDSIIELGPQAGQTTAIQAAASLYARNLWVGGAATLARHKSGGTLPSPPGGTWAVVTEYAKGVDQTTCDPELPEVGCVSFTSGVHVLSASDLAPSGGNNVTELTVGIRGSSAAPNDAIATQHLYNGQRAELLPSFETVNAVLAAGPGNQCGAVADGVFDNSKALARCVAMAAKTPKGVVVLGRGIYRLSETLVLQHGISLVGAGLHLTSLVPTSTGFVLDPTKTAAGAGTPLLHTTGGDTMVAGISISTWAHYESVSAVEWGSGANSLWIQNHVNRMSECGVSGGTPLVISLPAGSSSEDLATIPPCRGHVKINVPLVRVTGSGSFYNFYNEDAMGVMVAGFYQGPSYRHILVNDTANVRFYHLNPEHSVANANSEFRGSKNISVFGTKSEGHSATIWIRDCADVVHYGHAGNANPEPCDPETCHAWKPSPCACNWTTGSPSLFRVESCKGNCRFGNLWSQTSIATASVWLASGTATMVTADWDRPVVVATSDTLRCEQSGAVLECEHDGASSAAVKTTDDAALRRQLPHAPFRARPFLVM
jgi:hypothetical protein